jgi:hypothetical protein
MLNEEVNLMQVNGLTSFIMGIGIAAIIGAVVIVILEQMGDISGLSAVATGALGNASTAIGTIYTSWYGLIVLAGIAGIVIYLVINGIAGGAKR